MTKRLNCIVYGRVQGVSYRQFTKETAERLGLVGFVRNLSDGTVEVVVEGEKALFPEFLKALKEGYPFALVGHIDAVCGKATQTFSGFTILHS